MQTKGIDISVHNGTIDWKKVAKQVDFVILRAGYGKLISQKDKNFETNFTGCKNNNIKLGVYWYSYAKTVSEAEMEARACLSILNSRKLDMPVWYDVEEKSTFNTGKTNVSALTEAFLKIIADAGYKTGIYSSYSGLRNYFSTEVKNKHDIWMAHVASDGGALKSTSYPDKKDIWQFSWKESIDGISGNVDANYCYKDYFKEEKPSITPEIKPTVQENKTESNSTIDTIDVTYSSYIGQWLSGIKNCNDTNSNGYSGIENTPISGFVSAASKGKIKYRVHIKGGKWLSWIEKADKNDWSHGIAGIKGKTIDGIQAELIGVKDYKVKYRVSLIGNKNYLPWVTNWNNSANGYAGKYGSLIDKIQMKIVKE